MLAALVAALAAGVFIALQSGLLGGFHNRVAAITVALWVHIAGTVVALVGVLLTGSGFGIAGVREYPAGLLAGAAGVGIVATIAYAVNPLGLAATLAVVTGVQLLLAFVLEATGVFGERISIDPLRILGAGLIVAGVVLAFGRRSG